MRQVIIAAGLIGAICGAVPAQAVSGTLTGCLTYTEKRTHCSNDSGSRQPCTMMNQQASLRQIRVELWTSGVHRASVLTDHNGCFTKTYSDPSDPSFPINALIKIPLKNPKDFYITSASGGQFVISGNITIPDDNHHVNLSAGANDLAMAYATAQEFYERVVDGSANLRNRMTDVRITISADEEAGCNCMKDANHIGIASGKPTSSAWTIAHELGHSATAHSLNVADIGYPWVFDGDHGFFSVECCEKVAFHEASAQFFAATWAWTKNAPDPWHLKNSSWRIEDAPAGCTWPPPIPAPENGECTGAPWRCEGCIAAMMWDIFDDPSGDDDNIDDSAPSMALFNIVDGMNAYPDGCWVFFDDRCSNEGGDHGNNHWDFMWNFNDRSGDAVAVELEQICDDLGLTGGEEPF